MSPRKHTIYINVGETFTYEVRINTKNPQDISIPLNLTGKNLFFYVKKTEQEKDSDAFIIKSSLPNGGITITDVENGIAEIEISASDTSILEQKNITSTYKYSLRLVYGNINRFLSEGYFVITPR